MMKPGPELDALVAEKVMGWERLTWTDEAGAVRKVDWRLPDNTIRTWEPTSFGSFQPSTDIKAAWEVVERLTATHAFAFDLEWNQNAYPSKRWLCGFRTPEGGNWTTDEHTESVPHAICLAALMATESHPAENVKIARGG